MNTETELELISLFVQPLKKDRLSGFIKSGKRSKVLREMNSPEIFDERYKTELTGGIRFADKLLDYFTSRGMGNTLYIMSENSEWDGREINTKSILEECLAAGLDTIAFCKKSKTAFYEWHHSEATYYLSRKSNA